MLIHLNLEVYAGQSTVLHMSQDNATVETQIIPNVLIFTDSLARPFQFAVPIA